MPPLWLPHYRQGFSHGRILFRSNVPRRKNRYLYVGGNARTIKGLSVRSSIHLVWKAEPPAVRQAATQHVGKDTLCVLSNPRNMRSPSHQGLGKRLTGANGQRT